MASILFFLSCCDCDIFLCLSRRWITVYVTRNTICMRNPELKLLSKSQLLLEYCSVHKHKHLSVAISCQTQQLFDSHLFCKGCLIYCSGLATTWLSVCWSSVSADFWGKNTHKHTINFLCTQKTSKNIYVSWMPACPLIAIMNEVCTSFMQSYEVGVVLIFYQSRDLRLDEASWLQLGHNAA